MFDLDSLVAIYEIVQRLKQYCEEEHCIKLAKVPAFSIDCVHTGRQLICRGSEWVCRRRGIAGVSNKGLRRKILSVERLLDS